MSNLSIRVKGVKFGQQVGSVKFTASPTRKTVKCSCHLFRGKALRISQGDNGKYRAELLSDLDAGHIQASTPQVVFARAVNLWWC